MTQPSRPGGAIALALVSLICASQQRFAIAERTRDSSRSSPLPPGHPQQAAAAAAAAVPPKFRATPWL